MKTATLLTLALAGFAAAETQVAFDASTDFDPSSYTFQHARCPAVNREKKAAMEIELQYVDINPSAQRTLLLVHGWPSLWASWKYQIAEFQSDFRLIIPNLRGFGDSAHPGDVRTSGTMPDLVGDLRCILDAAGAKDPVVCLGHDWGTQTCFEAARQAPTRVAGVVGITIPYMPYAGPFVPMSALVPQLPHLAYQVYFDNYTAKASAELDKDVRRTLRATLRTVASPPPEGFLSSTDNFLGAYGDAEIPAITFLSPTEEDYWVAAYEKQGFDKTLYFYQTPARKMSWEAAQKSGVYSISQPSLSILDTEDPVANWPAAAGLLHTDQFLPQLTTKTMPGAHWVQLERPTEVNGFIREWLSSTFPDATSFSSASSSQGTSSTVIPTEETGMPSTPAPAAAETKEAHDEL
ncbi:alpha/beta-hydrolase [Peniophora sp. CONT]|nr:alpha/beta-hydrolase [Peniophora sp. CONT]